MECVKPNLNIALDLQTHHIELLIEGRFIDALTHIHIFGRNPEECFWPSGYMKLYWKDTVNDVRQNIPLTRGTHYSTDLLDAWKVIEFLAKKNIVLIVEPLPYIVEGECQDVFYEVAVFNKETRIATVMDDTAPLAICRAALSATKIMEKQNA